MPLYKAKAFHTYSHMVGRDKDICQKKNLSQQLLISLTTIQLFYSLPRSMSHFKSSAIVEHIAQHKTSKVLNQLRPGGAGDAKQVSLSLVDEVWNTLTAVLDFGVLKRIQAPHSLLNFILGFRSR